MSPKKQKSKKVFVILVANDFKHFDHYCMLPKVFYDTKQEAEIQLNILLETKQFEDTQLKVQTLWRILPLSTGDIQRMQISLGTKPDGIVGPNTRVVLNNSCESGLVLSENVVQEQKSVDNMSAERCENYD